MTGIFAGLSVAVLAAAQAPTAPPTTPAYPASSYAPPSTDIAPAVAQWQMIQRGDTLPFESYASFLAAHPDWPGTEAARRTAERLAGAPTASSYSVSAYCRRFPALTAGGGVACARAYLSSASPAEANAAVREGWRRGALTPADEAFVLTGFASALTPADHDMRVDALLWQGQTSAAARELGFTSASARPVLAARLAFRTNAPDAALQTAQADAYGLRDAGYLADKATWWRVNSAFGSARSLLAAPRTGLTRPGNVERWYEVLLGTARDAAASGDDRSAYAIASQIDDGYPAGTDVSAKPYGERDDYTSLAWLAGQTAYAKLGRPGDAIGMFTRYGNGSRAPQTRAKGFYWAGRAAERAGRATEASALFERAAGYAQQYYGQLALEHLRRPLTAPPVVPTLPLDPAARAAFYRGELVRAAQFLGATGQHKDQTAFVKAIADRAATPSDVLLAADLARQLGRADLAVMAGRTAMQNYQPQLAAIGFPTVAVPPGYEDQWTVIHMLARQESQFDREAVSNAGARGLIQLMPGTAREQAGKMGLPYDPARLTSDPQYNATLGSAYFGRLYAIYASYPLAIAAYNAGGGNVNKWLRLNGDPRSGAVDWVDWVEAIPFGETRNYVQRVLENAVTYDLMVPARAKSRGPANLSWYLGRSGRTG